MELIFILFIILAPISFLTLLEIMVLKESCEKTLKYLKLLKGIEIFFFLSSDGVIWLIICIIIYFTGINPTSTTYQIINTKIF